MSLKAKRESDISNSIRDKMYQKIRATMNQNDPDKEELECYLKDVTSENDNLY